MQRFILIRFVQAMIAVLVVSVIVFSLSHLSGDPLTTIMPMGDVEPEDIEALRAKWGLDKPLHTVSFWGTPFAGILASPTPSEDRPPWGWFY